MPQHGVVGPPGPRVGRNPVHRRLWRDVPGVRMGLCGFASVGRTRTISVMHFHYRTHHHSPTPYASETHNMRNLMYRGRQDPVHGDITPISHKIAHRRCATSTVQCLRHCGVEGGLTLPTNALRALSWGSAYCRLSESPDTIGYLFKRLFQSQI